MYGDYENRRNIERRILPVMRKKWRYLQDDNRQIYLNWENTYILHENDKANELTELTFNCYTVFTIYIYTHMHVLSIDKGPCEAEISNL